jgi:hypothetical protein
MSNNTDIWDGFDKVVREKFLGDKASIYEVLGTTSAMSEDFWICSLRKYIDEIIVKHRNPDSFDFPYENLLKIAHIASIVFSLKSTDTNNLYCKKSWD